MSGSKIFAGSRLRRIRNKLNLNQATLAQSLGISPSYLNLIERDQRPITAQLLLKLHTLHGVDIAELSGTEAHSETLARLKEFVADPLLNGEIPLATELTQAHEVAPNLVGATLKLYGAYREVLKRASDISQQMQAGGGFAVQNNFEAVQEWLQLHPLQPALEALAEEIWFDLSPKDDALAGLKARLRSSGGIEVRILPAEAMHPYRARHDRHAQRLLVSESLNAHERIFETALLLARLEGQSAITEILSGCALAKTAEAGRLLSLGLAKILAGAILCPAAKFSSAAVDLKWNIARLSDRFNVSPSVVMKRLATLSLREQSKEGIGLLTIASTGSVVDRVGPLGFHLPQSGALCGHLPHFTGERVSKLESKDGKTIFMVSHSDSAETSALCFTPEHFAQTTYIAQAARPLGSSCRLCEINGCALRLAPPATRPVVLNEYVRGQSDYEAL